MAFFFDFLQNKSMLRVLIRIASSMSTNNIHFQDKIIDFKLSQLYYNIFSYGKNFLRTQERVRNSRGKRAIRVRATEVLLYLTTVFYKYAIFGPE